jgi:hypothetical protein
MEEQLGFRGEVLLPVEETEYNPLVKIQTSGMRVVGPVSILREGNGVVIKEIPFKLQVGIDTCTKFAIGISYLRQGGNRISLLSRVPTS